MEQIVGVTIPIEPGKESFYATEAPLRSSATFIAVQKAFPAAFASLGPTLAPGGLSLILDKDGQVSGMFVPDNTPDSDLTSLGMCRKVVEALRDGVFIGLLVKKRLILL